jgi:hypothetical protein
LYVASPPPLPLLPPPSRQALARTDAAILADLQGNMPVFMPVLTAMLEHPGEIELQRYRILNFFFVETTNLTKITCFC